MQTLVLRLADPREDGSLRAAVERKFPTGGLVTLAFDCAWSDLSPGCARLTALVKPKSLMRR
jgi:hypothetical protein